MRKSFLLIPMIFLMLSSQLAAESHLLNFGYFYKNRLGEDDESAYLDAHGFSLKSINLQGDKYGFYYVLEPYYIAKVIPDNGTSMSFLEPGRFFMGLELLAGYGGDINLGHSGLIMGGGFLADTHYLNISEFSFVDLEFAFGLGGGINYYYHPKTKHFLINVGVSLSWKPFTYMSLGDHGTLEEFVFFASQKSINCTVNFGFGWRQGNRKKILYSSEN